MEQSLIVVLLLVACLVAVLLVQFARKEAAAERDAARRESTSLREEAREAIAEAQRREERVALREREIAADQRAAGEHSRRVDERIAVVARDEKRLAAERAEFFLRQQGELATLAGMDAEAAKAELIQRLTAEAKAAASGDIRRANKRAKEEADARAREILSRVIQRQAGESTTQQTVTWMALPSEEMKGRIIGREGRNIRAFEALTGVNLIVEEGVDAVMLSSFDIERREIAEATLSALIADGRIQPPRIEAAYRAAVDELPARNRDAGLDAIADAGLTGVHADVVDILGRLRLRTSYGQNVLAHVVECARIAADLALELGADVEVARRAAFFHDLGKAFSREREGTHASIGAAIAEQYGEAGAVVHAIAAHHDEVPPESIEAVIVQIADTMSAARPGARRADFEGYVVRLEDLEKMIMEYDGVHDVVAMSAGREVRVLVTPERVADAEVPTLARTIAERIANDPAYPGEIKVTVIRELRADAVAN